MKISMMGFQGELMVRRIAWLPTDKGLRQEQQIDGVHIIGHSETGHHHVILGEGVRRWEAENPLHCFLQVDAGWADITHLRSHDTHAPLRLGRGTWEVRRQREWSPEGWRRALD